MELNYKKRKQFHEYFLFGRRASFLVTIEFKLKDRPKKCFNCSGMSRVSAAMQKPWLSD